MKVLDVSECEVQIYICTNERPAPKTGCKNFGGHEFYQKIKDRLKHTGLSATHWVSRTGCLGFCSQVGTTVAIQPKGKDPRWFNEVTMGDFDFIWGEIVRQ